MKTYTLSFIFSFVFFFLSGTNADAQQVKEYFGATPDLKVSGKNLVDPYGNVVVLHGIMETPSAYFNHGLWTNGADWADYNSEKTVTDCLAFFTKVFEASANLEKGTFCNLFRLHLDPCWLQDNNIKAAGFTERDGSVYDPHGSVVSGEANIYHFSEAKLRTYLQKVYIPIIKDAIAHGLYVIIRPPGVFPKEIVVDDYYSNYLKTVWNIVSSDSYIKKNSGKISLELGNEPVHIWEKGTVNFTDRPWDYDFNRSVLADFFQPIVDVIRGNGFDGIIWLPGTGYQAEYRSYLKKMVTDPKNNIAFAAHFYSGWYDTTSNDETCKNTDAQVLSTFKTQVPVQTNYPVVITEVDWSPAIEGSGHYDEHGNWVVSNFGTWCAGSTSQKSRFGEQFKYVMDQCGNISWTIEGSLLYVDIAKYLKDGTVQPAFLDKMKDAGYENADQACSGACFKWYREYACGNNLPRFATSATSTGNVKFEPETNKYIFYTPWSASFEFPDFKGTKLKECADFTIKLKENTVGYRLDFQLKDANGNFIQTENPGDKTLVNYILGTEDNGMRITNLDKAKEQTFNIQELLKDYVDNYPDCTIENIRLNTVVSSEDTQKSGLYYFKIDKMDMNVNQVVASKSQGTILSNIPMYEYAMDVNGKGTIVDEYSAISKNMVISNDAEGSNNFGGWGADKIEVQSNVGKDNSKGYVLVNNNTKENDYTSQFNIENTAGYANGTEYSLRLDVKGTVAGSIGVAIQNPVGWKGCGNFPNLPITTSWETVTLKAIVNGDGAQRILLNFGKYVGTIYIDNIEVYTESGSGSDKFDHNIGTAAVEVSNGGMIYGTSSVDYNMYIDLTNYKTLKFTGTQSADGNVLRVLYNRQKDLNASGFNGSNKESKVDANASIDLQEIASQNGGYVHLHAIKAAWGDTKVKISSAVLTDKDGNTVSLTSLPFCKWDVKAEGEVEREITGFNKNFGTEVNNGEIYGVLGNVSYNQYADLSAYTKMIIKGSGGELRVLFNRITKDGSPVELNPSLSNGEVSIDLTKIDDVHDFVHLHSIKTYGTVNIESITLINEDDPNTFADYYISGAGSHAQSAIEALADPNATVIDVQGFTGKWDDNLTATGNPNCILIYKEENKIDDRFNGRNLAKRNGTMYDTWNISLQDNYPFRAPVNIATGGDATYSRNLSTQWATIPLPFTINDVSTAGAEMFVLKKVEGDYMNFEKVKEGSIHAGTVVLYHSAGSGATTIKGKNIAKTAEGLNVQPIEGLDGWFTAQSYTNLVIDNVATDPVLKDYDVYAITQDEFVNATQKLTLKPFRGIFLCKKNSNGAKARLSISITDDTPSDVLEVKGVATELEHYNAAGQRINADSKGLHIFRMSDGTTRKVLVR